MSTVTSTQPSHSGIPLARITTTELRKMLDTRAGLWTMASIGLLAFVTTSAVITWADRSDLTYSTFVAAISTPMTLVLSTLR